MIAIDRFGASAPGGTILDRFGFTAANVAAVARGVLDGTIRGVVSPPPGLEHSGEAD